MAQRPDRFQQHRTSTRNFLEWLVVAAASIVLAAFTVTSSAGELPVGQMLRPVGEAIDIAQLPTDGWYRVTDKDSALQVQAVAAPVSAPGEEEAEEIDTRYIRVPGARIAEGRLPTAADTGIVLAPGLNRAFHLELAGTPFTLTVRNGLVYTVATGEGSYSFYVDGGMSEESALVAVADIDSDGKPDFILRVGDRELLLLSSIANPGLNPPAAVLAMHTDGC